MWCRICNVVVSIGMRFFLVSGGFKKVGIGRSRFFRFGGRV